MSRWPWLIGVVVLVLTGACRPSARGKAKVDIVQVDDDSSDGVQESGKVEKKGVASDDTWLALHGFHIKLKVPFGWRYEQQGAMVVGVGDGQRAAYVVAGARDKSEAAAKLSAARDLLKLQTGQAKKKPKVAKLNGIEFLGQDFDAANVDGQPARAVALVADAPGGKGFLIFLGYVLDGQDGLGEELRDAINSIRAA